MNGDLGGFVAIIDAQRRIRAQIEYGDPSEEGPSRTRRAAASIGQQIASVVAKARETTKRRGVAQDPASIGD
jgi:hypothetical protein